MRLVHPCMNADPKPRRGRHFYLCALSVAFSCSLCSRGVPARLRSIRQTASQSKLDIPMAAMRAVETEGASNPEEWLLKVMQQEQLAAAVEEAESAIADSIETEL